MCVSIEFRAPLVFIININLQSCLSLECLAKSLITWYYDKYLPARIHTYILSMVFETICMITMYNYGD